MNILSYSYQALLTKIFKETTAHELSVKKLQLNTSPGLYNFLSIFTVVDNTLSTLARKTMKLFLEKLDYDFRYSFGRTNCFHIKAVYSRTIMTIFGLIIYKRTFYTFVNHSNRVLLIFKVQLNCFRSFFSRKNTDILLTHLKCEFCPHPLIDVALDWLHNQSNKTSAPPIRESYFPVTLLVNTCNRIYRHYYCR